MKLTVEFLGEEPDPCYLPEWVELRVSSPSGLGSLQDGSDQAATLSNGLQVQCRQFIKAGRLVKVNVARKIHERLKK